MLKDSFNAVEVIEMAKNIEKRGAEFYQTQADQVEDSDLKDLFSRLAEEENYHYKRFVDLAENIKEEVKDKADYVYDQDVSSYLQAIVEFSVFPEKGKVKISSVNEALLYATRAEKESIIFYQEMLNYNSGETAKMLKDLMQEEKQHLVDLVHYRDKFSK